MELVHQNYSMTAAEDGMTVKTYLHSVLRLSGAQVTALKKEERGILVDGTHVTVRHILRAGQTLSLAVRDADSSDHIVPTPMPLNILYEDEAILVLNKPPYTPTHPSHGHYTDTLANGLAALFEKRGVPFVFRSCSRLDRDTSGVVTVAKNRAAAYRFQCAHTAGEVQKEYLTVLCGHVPTDSGALSGSIRREQDSVITRVVADDGAPALTRYRVLARGYAPDGQPLSLVTAQPVTGRTHQLRVHFSHMGYPILGDFLYGRELSGADALICRQALHCRMTAFAHPVSGRFMTVCAAPPDDFLPLLRCFDGFEGKESDALWQ